MLFATAAAKDGELRHFEAEQALLKAEIDEGIYIKISEEYQEIPPGSEDAHVDDNDDTAGHCVRCTRCGQVS